MKKLLTDIKKQTRTFIFLNIYILLLIFLPKSFSNVFGFPIRLILTFLMIFIILFDKYTNKIKFNKTNNKLFNFLILLFFVFSIPSLFKSYALITSIYTLIKFISVFILLNLIIRIDFNKKEYKILIINLLSSTLILGVLGILQYITGFGLMIKNSGVEHYPGAKGRVSLTFFNTIYYGIFINLVFSIVFILYNKLENKKISMILYILCMLLYVNLLLTFTRSAIIIFSAIALLLVILFNKKIFNKKTLLIFISIIMITNLVPGAKPLVVKSFRDVVKMSNNILSFLPGVNLDFIFLDYNDESDYVDYSLQHREAFATIAKKIANDNLYTGVGAGAYIDYMNSKDFDLKYPEYNLRRTHPHSAFILMFAEVGVFALIIFILILIMFVLMPFSKLFSYYKKDENKYSISSIIFVIGAGFFVVNAMSENAFYDTQITYLFITIFGLLYSYVLKPDEKKRVLFISSTGGHLNELLQLTPLINKYDSYLITEKTKSNLSLKNKYNNVKYLIYGTKKNKIKYILKFSTNIIISFWYYLRMRPNVIITTGTHTAVPMCYIGKLFGSKIIFIETFANSETKTVSGQLVYPIADTFIVQWESMLKLYPKAKFGGWIY